MDKEHLKFSTVKEGFCEYEVENGQVLKVMVVLTDILVETKEDTKIPTVGLKDLSVVITDVEIDTSGMEYARREEVTEKDQIKELQFKPLTEIMNMYETQNYIFLIPVIVNKVFLTSKKDTDENPILRFTYESRVSTIDKTALYAKSTKQTS